MEAAYKRIKGGSKMDKNNSRDVKGYTAQSVHRVIQKIQAIHEKEIQALKEEILKFKKENEELAQKMSEGGRDFLPPLSDNIAYTPMTTSFWGDIEKYLDENQVSAYHELVSSAEPESKRELFIPRPTVEEAMSPPKTMDKSDSINSEIQSIRNRYIVGRLAGEDLYGTDGKLIIQKHETITETVVDIADRDGKLADLIVNMIIPMDTIKNKKGEGDV